ASCALDRRFRKHLPECRVVETGEVGEARGLQFVPRRKLHLVAGLRELVPRAYRQTIVAAEDAVADRGAQLARNRPRVLDGEVGDAAARIEPVGRGERRRRADVETSTTSAAVIDLRRVRRQIERGEDRAEEQPRPELARDQIGVLALPAEAGGGGERLL